MKTKIPNKNAQALGRRSAEVQKEKYKKGYSKEMSRRRMSKYLKVDELDATQLDTIEDILPNE